MSPYFLGGVGGAPFAEGLEAFCLGGPAFFGFRSSLLPFDIHITSYWSGDDLTVDRMRWCQTKVFYEPQGEHLRFMRRGSDKTTSRKRRT